MRSFVVVLAVVLVSCGSNSPGDGGTGGGSGGSGGGSATGGGATSGGGTATGGGSTTGGGSATGGGSGHDAGYLADPTVTGHVLDVCPSGCTYSKPSLAFAAAVDGDTIQVGAGDYTDCGTLTANNVIVRGVSDGSGNKPRMGGQTCGRKAIIIVKGNNTLIENLELHDSVDPTTDDENWACVRMDEPNAYNLKLRDCWLHDADDGFLGTNQAPAHNTVVFENTRFEKLGRAGYAHGMYLGTAVDVFVLRTSVVRDNHDDGHLVKSRAKQNIIECNTIASLNGENSYAIDLPQGGNATVRNNVVEQGPNINNGGNFFIQFGEENDNNAPHSLSVSNTKFINDYGNRRGQINVARPATAIVGWSGNTYVGNAEGMELDVDAGASFTVFPTRAAANLPAYDGTMNSLPAVMCP